MVGSGVAGLTAAYVASDPAHGAHVTLLEADDRLGGHADTHDVTDPTGRRLRIDSGFIVHNRAHLPGAAAPLRRARRRRPRSRRCRCRSATRRPAWSGPARSGRRGVFPGRRRQPPGPRLPADAARDPPLPPSCPGAARRGGRPGGGPDDAGRLPRRGRLLAVLPSGTSWSRWSQRCGRATRRRRWTTRRAYLFAFLSHHGMLPGHSARRTWRTVDRRLAHLRRRGRRRDRAGGSATSAPAHRSPPSRETADGVEVVTTAGAEVYDAVVVATHPDQALGDAGRRRRRCRSEMLGAIAVHARTPRCCTPTPGCCPPRDRRARRRGTSAARRRRRAGRCW